MTPKEKALELYLRFHDYAHDTVSSKDENNPWYGETLAKKRIVQKNSAKECAVIAVDAILLSGPSYPNNVDWDDVGGAHQYYYEAQREEADKWWKEVKREISNI